ncbi:MAG: MATE family efflux transporter [Clostridium sp.]|nr:MATE family efflux transporter [Prevotella sp.]MCM1429404.1 MATE family efflux transporter [Clostridium sp.]MCM1475561.1 MATE family efflux transporter [Muribaculaceae bacterium]
MKFSHEDLSFGSLNRRVLTLALPAIVSNITVPLLGLCDTVVTGHLGSPAFIAAIAGGSMMVNVIFFLFGFLRMGSTGLTAEAYGAGNRESLCIVFSRSFWIAVLSGLIIILCSFPLSHFLVNIIDPDPKVADLARSYFQICVLGAPAQLVIMALMGWMVGMQSTVRPMILSISVNIVNIAMSLSFVFLFKLGFIGVALGTLSANWFGFFLAILLAKRCLPAERLFRPLKSVFISDGLKKFFSLNINLFFRSACVMAVSMAVTSIGARLGILEMAVNAVIMQFFIFFSYCMDGFAFAAEALCGKCYGARDSFALRKYIRVSILWAATMAFLFFAVYALGANKIVELITSDIPVINATMSLYVPIILLPPVSVAAFIFDGFYIGMMETRRMLYATFTGMAMFFIVAFFHPFADDIFSLPSNIFLWIAFLTYLALRGLVLAVFLPSTIKLKFHD